MRNECRSCITCTLKIVNSIITVGGIGMISYSLWMLKKWKAQQHLMLFMQPLSQLPFPWFIYMCLTMGIIICFISFLGHFAVETANGFSLSVYIFLVTLLLMLQGGACSFVLLKKNWEDYIPKDSTGQFNQLKEFIEDNITICKYTGFTALLVQGLTILMAFILQTLGPEPGRHIESNDEYEPFRHDVKQSFLVEPSNLSICPELKMSLSDVSSMGAHQNGVEEGNLSSSQVDQSDSLFE
uniref:Tetraspanin n=1 Tax=Araucaria cunninghamii TaxID=56994 RepID=A0A0D6QT19_ARACU